MLVRFFTSLWRLGNNRTGNHELIYDCGYVLLEFKILLQNREFKLIFKGAKLGFELETSIQFELDGTNGVTHSNPKGQLVEFFGPDSATGPNGKLPQLSLLPPPNAQEGSPILVSTAEIGSNLSAVRIEFIFGGQKGAFFGDRSQNMSLQVGNKIVEVMTKWARFPQPKAVTMRVGLNKGLPAPDAPLWHCRFPKEPFSHLPLGQDFMGQMTAAFPLVAIPSILVEERSLVFNGSRVSQYFQDIKTADIENALDTSWGVQWRTGIWRSSISAEYGSNSILGFLILVQSYVQVARPEASSGDNDLKLKTPIMPRTDFRIMLRLITDLMTPDAAAAFAKAPGQAMPILMRVMGKLNTQLDTKNWFWNRSTVSEVRLSVIQWLQDLCAQPGVDQIAINDGKFRNEQIGGLKNKVERMIGTEGKANAPMCPILEFHTVGSLKWTQVSSQAQAMFGNPEHAVNYEAGTSILQTLEQWVRGHHSKALSSYSRASTPAATTAIGSHATAHTPGFIPREFRIRGVPCYYANRLNRNGLKRCWLCFRSIGGRPELGCCFQTSSPSNITHCSDFNFAASTTSPTSEQSS